MVQIDIRTFYKNTITNSSIGNLKPDNYVSNCIDDPHETGLIKLEAGKDTYDIHLEGKTTDEEIKAILKQKDVPDDKLNNLVNLIKAYKNMPDYNLIDGTSTSTGCSKVDIADIDNNSEEREELNMHTTNIKLLFDGKTYEIIHKDKIQILYNKIFDNPNKIALFFYVLLMSALVLFIYSILGVCFEFWLRYGNAPDCIYYKSDCNTLNPVLSMIQYAFPSEICDYPYQTCKSKLKQTGGLKGGNAKNSEKPGIKSTYSAYNLVSAKCINLDSSEPIFTGKAFPYNIADLAEDNFKNETIKSIGKTISFTFLYVVLTTRYLIKWVLSNISAKYQTTFRGNAIMANILFLFLSGLLFGLIAGLTKNSNVLFGAFWPLAAISFLITIGTTGVSLMLSIYYIWDFFSFALYRSWNPEKYNKEKDKGFLRFLPPMFETKDERCSELYNLN